MGVTGARERAPGSVLSVVVAPGGDAAATLAALAREAFAPGDLEVVLVGSGGFPPAPGQQPTLVVRDALPPAAAANAGLAAASGEACLLLRAGDVPQAGVLGAHVDELRHGAAAVAAAVLAPPGPGHWPRRAWLRDWPAVVAAHTSRHLSVRRDLLLEMGGLDDRLEDLDVAAIDLAARLGEAGHDVRRRPDLQVAGGAESPESAGRAARALATVLTDRGAPMAKAGGRVRLLRWVPRRLCPDAHGERAAFARGHGMPPLPLGPRHRAGLPAAPSAVRPPVALVVPFAGTVGEADAVVSRLAGVERGSADEIVLVDNSPAPVARGTDGVRVIRATGERSSYHARNAGVAATRAPWLLFTDADCTPVPWILDAHFSPSPAAAEGALAGAVLSEPPVTWAQRHADLAGVLSQAAALEGGWRPYGATANLLVRREAHEAVGGFAEGIRSGGDADFCWRLQEAGWQIGWRPRAVVRHTHRRTLWRLCRQYARYGAGVAWLHGRHPDSAGEWPVLAGAEVRELLRDLAGARFTQARSRATTMLTTSAAFVGYRLHNRPSRKGLR